MRPHPPLTPHYQSADDKPAFVNQLFDRGAIHYDRVVDWGFLRSGARYRRYALRRGGVRPGQRVLDVACGTGLVAVEIARLLGSAESVTCVDPSTGMLEVARSKLTARFVEGRAEALPLPDNSFDVVTMGYALRHVTDLDATFREYARVLKPGGRVLVLEVTKPASRLGAWVFRVYFGQLYPFLAGLFTRSADARKMMKYYWETMDACVPPAEVLAAMQRAGFTKVFRRVQLGLFSEYAAQKRWAPPPRL